MRGVHNSLSYPTVESRSEVSLDTAIACQDHTCGCLLLKNRHAQYLCTPLRYFRLYSSGRATTADYRWRQRCAYFSKCSLPASSPPGILALFQTGGLKLLDTMYSTAAITIECSINAMVIVEDGPTG